MLPKQSLLIRIKILKSPPTLLTSILQNPRMDSLESYIQLQSNKVRVCTVILLVFQPHLFLIPIDRSYDIFQNRPLIVTIITFHSNLSLYVHVYILYVLMNCIGIYELGCFCFLQKNLISNGRSAFLGESLLGAPVSRLDGNLGPVRGYLAAIGANKNLASKLYLSDLNYLLFANPRLRRSFSSEETPKKKSKTSFGLNMYLFSYLNCLSFASNIAFVPLCFCLQIMRTSTQKKRKKFQKGMSRNPSQKVGY